MSPPPPRGAAPRALLDAVRFGLQVRIVPGGRGVLDEFRHNLDRRGLLVPGCPAGALKLRVGPAHDSPEGACLHVELRVGAISDERIVFTSSSSASLNPMRMLRSAIGGRACGPLAVGKEDNLVGPTLASARDLLPRQLALVEAAFARLEDGLVAALPAGADFAGEDMWLRSAEACLDIERADAVALVRSLSRSAVAGAARVVVDAYRVSADGEAEGDVARWWPKEVGPVLKAYVKRRAPAGLVRAEVACARRHDFRDDLASPHASVGGPEAVALLLGFAAAAEPHLDRLVDHVERAGDAATSPVDLLVSLLPLVELAAGRRPGRGRPPGRESVDAARDALDSLLTRGLCCATNLPAGLAVRRVLEALSVDGSPLARDSHHATYTLRPPGAAAACALAALT